MAAVTFSMDGDFTNTYKFLTRLQKGEIFKSLEKYGEKGRAALAAATPKDSGKTAASWTYKVDVSNGGASITWDNTNENNGVKIAVILQMGHGTGTGGYVQGRDYINPAMRPIFDKIASDVWKEVTR